MRYNDRFKFRAYYQGRFIYKSLADANYYDKDNKCIGLANTLPNSLEWEQCTGLRDKNGNLIYERDIVHYVKHTNLGIGGNRYAKVFWWENIQGFAIETNYGDYYGLTDFEIEIVGTIHENGDLLK